MGTRPVSRVFWSYDARAWVPPMGLDCFGVMMPVVTWLKILSFKFAVCVDQFPLFRSGSTRGRTGSSALTRMRRFYSYVKSVSELWFHVVGTTYGFKMFLVVMWLKILSFKSAVWVNPIPYFRCVFSLRRNGSFPQESDFPTRIWNWWGNESKHFPYTYYDCGRFKNNTTFDLKFFQ